MDIKDALIEMRATYRKKAHKTDDEDTKKVYMEFVKRLGNLIEVISVSKRG